LWVYAILRSIPNKLAALGLGRGWPSGTPQLPSASHSFLQPGCQGNGATRPKRAAGQARPPAWYPWMNMTCTVLLPMFVISKLPGSLLWVPPRGGGSGGGLRLPPNTAAALAIACSAAGRARRQSQTCCEACGSAAAAVCSGGCTGVGEAAAGEGARPSGTGHRLGRDGIPPPTHTHRQLAAAEGSQQSQAGMASPPARALHGETRLTVLIRRRSAAASPARRLALPGVVPDTAASLAAHTWPPAEESMRSGGSRCRAACCARQ